MISDFLFMCSLGNIDLFIIRKPHKAVSRKLQSGTRKQENSNSCLKLSEQREEERTQHFLIDLHIF